MSILKDLAKKMGDAGYCNYAACEEYLQQAHDAGRREGIEAAAKLCEYERKRWGLLAVREILDKMADGIRSLSHPANGKKD